MSATPTTRYAGSPLTKVPAGGTVNKSFIAQTSATLTADEVNALYTTAISVVPAQGANTTIEVLGCEVVYNYGSAAFTIGSATNLQLKYVDKSGVAVTNVIATTGFIDQTVNMFGKLIPTPNAATATTTAVAVTTAQAVNVPVCLTLAGGNPSVGTGSTLGVRITYAVHTIA